MAYLKVLNANGFCSVSHFFDMICNNYGEGTRLRYRCGSSKIYEFYYKVVGRTSYLYYSKIIHGERSGEFDNCIATR